MKQISGDPVGHSNAPAREYCILIFSYYLQRDGALLCSSHKEKLGNTFVSEKDCKDTPTVRSSQKYWLKSIYIFIFLLSM